MRAPAPVTDRIEEAKPHLARSEMRIGDNLPLGDDEARSRARTLRALQVPALVVRWIVVILAVIVWILVVPVVDLLAQGLASVRTRLRR